MSIFKLTWTLINVRRSHYINKVRNTAMFMFPTFLCLPTAMMRWRHSGNTQRQERRNAVLEVGFIHFFFSVSCSFICCSFVYLQKLWFSFQPLNLMVTFMNALFLLTISKFYYILYITYTFNLILSSWAKVSFFYVLWLLMTDCACLFL